MVLLSRREQKLGYKIREDTDSRVMCRKFCTHHRRDSETAELPRAKRVGNGCARRSLPVQAKGVFHALFLNCNRADYSCSSSFNCNRNNCSCSTSYNCCCPRLRLDARRASVIARDHRCSRPETVIDAIIGTRSRRTTVIATITVIA